MTINGNYQNLRNEVLAQVDPQRQAESLMRQLALSVTLLGVTALVTLRFYSSLQEIKWQLIAGGSFALLIGTVSVLYAYKKEQEDQENGDLAQKTPKYPNLENLSEIELLRMYKATALKLTNYCNEKEKDPKKAIIALYNETHFKKEVVKTGQNLLLATIGLIAAAAILITLSNSWNSVIETVGIFGLTAFVATSALISTLYSAKKLHKLFTLNTI